MSKLINYPEPRKPKETLSKDEKLIKNQECVSCRNLFNCKGKPRGIEACLNYSERRKD